MSRMRRGEIEALHVSAAITQRRGLSAVHIIEAAQHDKDAGHAHHTLHINASTLTKMP